VGLFSMIEAKNTKSQAVNTTQRRSGKNRLVEIASAAPLSFKSALAARICFKHAQYHFKTVAVT
jgi:hypothetical protein